MDFTGTNKFYNYLIFILFISLFNYYFFLIISFIYMKFLKIVFNMNESTFYELYLLL